MPYLVDGYHFGQLLLAMAFVIIGACHLPAEYLVNQYTHIYHTDFNAQASHPQLIMLSWVKCIGVLLIIQGTLMWVMRKPSMTDFMSGSLKWVAFQTLINVALIYSLWHAQANTGYMIHVPAIILVMVHSVIQTIYIFLYVRSCPTWYSI
jgi:hypothetical protein